MERSVGCKRVLLQKGVTVFNVECQMMGLGERINTRPSDRFPRTYMFKKLAWAV